MRCSYLYRLSDTVPAESHVSGISWSVSREALKYRGWMKRRHSWSSVTSISWS